MPIPTINKQSDRDAAPGTGALCPACGGNTMHILWDLDKETTRHRIICKDRTCDLMGPLAESEDDALERFLELDVISSGEVVVTDDEESDEEGD